MPLALVALLGAIIGFATGIVIFFVVHVTGGHAGGGAPAFLPLTLPGAAAAKWSAAHVRGSSVRGRGLLAFPSVA